MNLKSTTNTHRSSRPNSHKPPFLLSYTFIFLTTLMIAFLSGTVFLGISTSSAYDDATVDINLEVDQVLSLTTDALQGSINLPVTPTPTGSLTSNTLTVDVSTNNSTGYTLTMESITQPNQTSNLLGTALVHTILSDDHSVLSTTTPIASPTTLPINTWGYSNWTDAQISTNTTPTTFYRIPESGSPDTIRITREPALSSISKLTYAANINTDTASGTYTNTLLFSAVSNDPPVLDYGLLQSPGTDFYKDICTTTRGVAIDGRNGQAVFVRRVPGSTSDGIYGNTSDLCWMETNLRYAGDGTNILEDGEVIISWGDDRYATSVTNDTDRAEDDLRPLIQVGSSSTTPLAYDQAQYVDPGGSYPLNTSSDANGTAYYNNSEYYGYLYNWCAAMGGQGEACNDTNSNQNNVNGYTSICPYGRWRLPSATEVERYLEAIGATNTPGGAYNLLMNSLNTFSGAYSSGLSGQNTFGNIWTYTMASATDATNMNFTNTTVSPNSTSYKNSAYAIRCVIEYPRED